MNVSPVELPLSADLNPEQRQAVQHTDGPLLLLAGAGSGKTRVITYRIAYLIEGLGVRPESILAVTFTNKAADQMRDRVHELLKESRSANPLICTFHSFCVRLLRREIGALGYTKDFVIYDETDQESVMKECLKEVGLDAKALTPRSVLSQVSYAKNHGISPSQLYQTATDPRREQFAILFDHYEKKLHRANALDFDDLLLRAVELLGDFPEVRARVNERFQHILVDEYQDTNQVQYRLIRHLTKTHHHLCVVGDEDQSIYRWRGADIQNILNFEQDYPDACLIKLERNYRSTQIILDAASAVVANNLARKGKTLWTDRKGGEQIGFYEAPESEGESVFVAQKTAELKEKNPDGRFAVLYRTNAQSRAFEEAFRRSGLSYHIVGGFSFYDRAEIKDVLAYLKFALNTHDSVSLRRIINTPPRGIGKSTLEALEHFAESEGVTLWQALETALERKAFPERNLAALGRFRTLVLSIQQKLERATLPEIIERIIEASGYRHLLEEEDSEESLSRLENLSELENAAAEAADRQESLQDFLDHTALVSDQDSFDPSAAVSLMTIHCAKGLEFSTVFVAGLEEGLFPHSRSLMTQEELEEERRLFYVAMTRAQDHLFLSRVRERRYYGAEFSDATEPSRFLEEIPAQLMNDLSRGAVAARKNRVYDGATYNTVDHIKALLKERGIDSSSRGRTRLSSSHAPTPSPLKWKSRFQLGSLVRHPKYGVGTVLRSEGEGDNVKLSVQFPRYGLKKLIEKFAGLEKA